MMKEEKTLQEMEDRLAQEMQPVTPRPAFVTQLGDQLRVEMERKSKFKQVRKGILVAGGILGGLVMIATLIKTLTSWDGFTDFMSGIVSRQKEKHQTASA